ncbi:TolB-like translocation protein [Glycomyces terrestris]|uniref:Uncharacterized protein n=1 Tax=Glycomyces terrestris TaxID=2493553 RepID=A0A426V1A6_9ACTN|nr:hypothetical protein [Glycomyces terrestris]RRS00661.1 hypothetical protein EIW28_08925 [Glycomyces terrestris]
MPESIRSLLHDIADEGSAPSRDLAAGAYRRARAITRRRIAIGAVGVVTALALAGAGTAGLLDRGEDRGPSPADPTTESEDVDESEAVAFGCGVRPQDWADSGVDLPERGESGTERELDELPFNLDYRVAHDEFGVTTWRFSQAGEIEGLDDGDDVALHMAPDGNRAVMVDRSDGCGAAYVEIGADTDYDSAAAFSVEPVHCPMAWSPDSDKLLFTEPVAFEEPKTYVLDPVTGEATVLAEMEGDGFCAGEWLADGERIWADRTTILNLDGTVDRELPALEASLETEDWLDAGISADGGEACFDEVGEEAGDTTGRYCDVYVDTATGEELELPVGGEDRHVVFLYDGSMLILSHEGEAATQYLVDPEGEVIDQRDLPADLAADAEELVTYYPW